MPKEARWTRCGIQPLAEASPPLKGDECATQFTFTDGHGGTKHLTIRKPNLAMMRKDGERSALTTLAQELGGRIQGGAVIAPR